ncbi:MAG: PH domain-containing protein [Actinomycetaceae bacterium]|nr:PH domain-containing protein [Actinomycetaceae bacterium]MDO5747016.1 PH domain-containing protein [Actinomycetaceae bacterium]
MGTPKNLGHDVTSSSINETQTGDGVATSGHTFQAGNSGIPVEAGNSPSKAGQVVQAFSSTSRTDIGKVPLYGTDNRVWFRGSPLVMLSVFSAISLAIFWFIVNLLSSGASIVEIIHFYRKAMSEIDGVASFFSILHSTALGAVAVIVMVLVTSVIVMWLSWKNTLYSMDDTYFHCKTGIIAKNHRRVPLTRIQNVNISRTLVQRIFGYATVTIESAGAGDSHIILKYIHNSYAKVLQDIVMDFHMAVGTGSSPVAPMLATCHHSTQPAESPAYPADYPVGRKMSEPHLAGNEVDSPAEPDSSPSSPGANIQHHNDKASSHYSTVDIGIPPSGLYPAVPSSPHNGITYQERYRVAPSALLVSVFLNGPLLTVSVIIFGVVIVSVIIFGFSQSLDVAFGAASVFFGGFIAFTVSAVSVVFGWWQQFSKFYKFKALANEMSIRISSGLLSTVTRTIPRHRIHAIHIRQTMLWRLKDFWSIKVTLAGTSAEGGQNYVPGAGILLPAGSKEQAQCALDMILDDFDVHDKESIINAIFGKRDASQLYEGQQWLQSRCEPLRFYAIAPSARWLHPIASKYIGIASTQQCTISRSGRFSRHFSVVPHSHVQALQIIRGPLQRILGTGKARLHLVTAGSAASSGVPLAIDMPSLRPLELKKFVTHQPLLIRENWTLLSETQEAREAVESLDITGHRESETQVP